VNYGSILNAPLAILSVLVVAHIQFNPRDEQSDPVELKVNR
jgi:hypothetical protein